jgi:bifunctional non-homologous end joining protein LigD
VPAGKDWLHEIKHDGYRLIVQRDHKRVRLFTRSGYDWAHRYPLIREAALRHKSDSFVIDGEAVLLGPDEVQLYAFDMRKASLARLLARLVDGIHLAPFEEGEIGPDLFRHAYMMGLEGMVSKHRERPYRADAKTG